METKATPSFWWLKTPSNLNKNEDAPNAITSIPKLSIDISSSLANFIDKEREVEEDHTDVDIGSIIEEINRVAAQSPLGPYDNSPGERSVEDIMKEAERIYVESSKSFEQLSNRSKTSQNITELNSGSSKNSTPTPKSVSPLPLDTVDKNSDESYSEDFSNESRNTSMKLKENNSKSIQKEKSAEMNASRKSSIESLKNVPETVFDDDGVEEKQKAIENLTKDNEKLKENIVAMREKLEETNALLEEARLKMKTKQLQSPEINLEFDRTVEKLKDTEEMNTVLQVQLDGLNKSHQLLKSSYEELLGSNKILERRTHELDTTLAKYKGELVNIQRQRDNLSESEQNLTKLLEVEKIHTKNLKTQNEKDAMCILDLNRQIKEMERIMSRKHPDSVSALIVAAKDNPYETNSSARRVLEERIKALESEAASRDSQSSKIFLEVQEKFNQMKAKYESHIEDLELHVADLKEQLKKKNDSYDVYTQTTVNEEKIPQKETSTRGVQTEMKTQKILPKNLKDDAHLLATIRGLQTDLSNKEKTILKLHRELEDYRNTNKRLQKEREGSLKNLSDAKQFRSYPERMSQMSVSSDHLEEELKNVKAEKEKLKLQLCRLESDYQNLKTKRLQDLTVLQEAHEREISTYLSNITPLREQLEVQQVSLSTLQMQLSNAKEELAIMTVERDHLNNRLNSIDALKSYGGDVGADAMQLHKKIAHLEKRYEEREHRLRAIVHGLAQRNVSNKSCEQCAVRQQQLIGYKIELDQILTTLRSLQ